MTQPVVACQVATAVLVHTGAVLEIHERELFDGVVEGSWEED